MTHQGTLVAIFDAGVHLRAFADGVEKILQVLGIAAAARGFLEHFPSEVECCAAGIINPH